MTIRAFQELSDEEVECSSIEDLRIAYRALREHHVAETSALLSRRDDLTRRRDEQLLKTNEHLAQSQKLIDRAETIMRSDEQTIDHLGAENARLAEIIDFMQNHYSPIGGRPCALCVYAEGRVVRSCALHRWQDTAAKVLASRAATSRADLPLSDEELTAWAADIGLGDATLTGSYLGLVVDELRDRRAAEIFFAEIDREFQAVDCRTCDDVGADNCEPHAPMVKRWRSARAALCDIARFHRGYVQNLADPDEGDPR